MTMPLVNPGEVWIIDFGMTAKVRPALLLTDNRRVTELAPHPNHVTAPAFALLRPFRQNSLLRKLNSKNESLA
jgi:hypothetical protein